MRLAPLGQMSQRLEALASFLTVSEDAPLAPLMWRSGVRLEAHLHARQYKADC